MTKNIRGLNYPKKFLKKLIMKTEYFLKRIILQMCFHVIFYEVFWQIIKKYEEEREL